MLGRARPGGPAEGLDRLAARVEELEARCAALTEALAARERRLEEVALDQSVLSRRLEQQAQQSERAIAGLVEQLQALRPRPLEEPGPRPDRRAMKPPPIAGA